MKKLILCLALFFLLTGNVGASEYNIALWQNDNQTHTFISILNATYKSVVIDLTVKDSKGVIIYTKTQTVEGGKAWYIDTVNSPFQGFGTMNIFVNDSINSKTPMAITALLYGKYNIAVQVWKY